MKTRILAATIIFFVLASAALFIFKPVLPNGGSADLSDAKPVRTKLQEQGFRFESEIVPDTFAENPPGVKRLASTSPDILPKKVFYQVPFTAQAPFADWEDDRQQDGCEEAASLMAVKWLRGESMEKREALEEILAISAFELKTYGGYRDTSARDTNQRILKGYFGYDGGKVVFGAGAEDIVKELAAGNLVLAPVNGQKLGNPFFTAPGPERHMLLIRGYDLESDEFITNDPGTRRGEGYRYRTAVVESAMLDYPTGDHKPIVDFEKAIIVIRPLSTN